MSKLNPLLICILICFSVAAGCMQVSVHDLPELYKKALPSVVEVISIVSPKEIYNSSGFIIDKNKGLIVTAGHSAKYERSIRVKLASEQIIDANIYAIDRDNDIAILKVNPSILKQLFLSELKLSTNICPGEFIYAIGSPFGFTDVMTLGIVGRSTIYNINDICAKFPDGIFISDITVAGGSSGCPVFNLKGCVVAMVVGYFSDDNGNRFSILVPAKSIQNLIDAINAIN